MTTRAKGRNPLKRKQATRKIKDVCFVICEGCTEEDYLNMDAIRDNLDCALKLIRRHPGQSDPASLVRTISKKLEEVDFRKHDSAWIAMDVDEWTKEQIGKALAWSRSDERFHLAISNPKFELFLVMHYGLAKGCLTSSSIDTRLKAKWPDYAKRIPANKFSLQETRNAMSIASQRERIDRSCIPHEGSTGFPLMLDEILEK